MTSIAQPVHRPISWWKALIGLVLGYAVAHGLLAAFIDWASGDQLEWIAGYIKGKTGLGVGLVGGGLGFAGGLWGFGIYRKAGVPRALLWGALSFVLFAAAVMTIRTIFGMPSYEVKPVIAVALFGLVPGFMAGIGGFTYWVDYVLGRPTPEHEDHSGHGAVNGWKSYFTFNTDHKVIGIQYIVTTFAFFLIGGLLAELVRAELANPGQQYFSAEQFNGLFSVHAVLMIFLFIIPVFAGIANYVLPIMIGAPDMAFPRLNAFSFWLLPLGGMVFLSSFLVGPFNVGWTNYAPLSVDGGLGQLFFLTGVQMVGASSIMTAINFIATIITMRAPGMTMWRMPLLVWANLTTSLLVVFGTPFIAGAQFMVLFDTVMGTHFFDPSKGGDVLMYQHVFWFYSHPAVYIMMLPGFGIISEVIATHSRKPLFGYKALALATMAIGVLGFGVWAHHMFVSGMQDWLRVPMMITTMLIAVPTGVKVFGWLGTLWQGTIHLTTPMLFALGFLFTFTLGGLSGLTLAALPFVIQVSDSYYVVAHIHYVLFGGSVMTIFAGIYHWFPKMTGRMYNEKLGKLHFWSVFVFMNLTFGPMHWVGTQGMPRRVADYLDKFHFWNFFESIAALGLGAAMLIFFYNMIVSWRSGVPAPGNPWQSRSLEWLVSSPPPLFNFYDTPKVLAAPYEYGTDTVHAIVAEAPHHHNGNGSHNGAGAAQSDHEVGTHGS